MGFWQRQYLRHKRRVWALRGLSRSRRQLSGVQDRTATIRRGDILLLSTLRNERARLPYFLKYYRDRGVDHFLIVDNDSSDGSGDYLAAQPDVSLWHTRASYAGAHFGADWLNGLAFRYGNGHWCLTVDPDEFLVYPFCDTRPIRALTDWLDASALRSFPAMLLDMYPKGPIGQTPYREGQNPFEILQYFDPANYSVKKDSRHGNLWIQGGPRARAFFTHKPLSAPALNKTPLVKWSRGIAYVSSTHTLLPRGLNNVYDEYGGEKASGILLHAKFLDSFVSKAAEEVNRGQHYADGAEYKAYHARAGAPVDLWTPQSEHYLNWNQLELLGLMSKGNWA